MSMKIKSSLSGRASLAALVLVIAAICVGVFPLARNAKAQGSGSGNPVEFAPNQLADQSLDAGGGNLGLNVHCLLPAAPKATSPYSIVAKTPYGTATYNVPIGGETIGWYEIYLTSDGGKGEYLVIFDNNTNAYGYADLKKDTSGSTQVAVSIQPATRENGDAAMPTSAELLLKGYDMGADDDSGIYYPYVSIAMPYSK